MVHHSCSAFPCECFVNFLFRKLLSKGQLSIQPLCVCATFITVMQIAALLLISWMEQNANFREEAISLQAKSKAQQESIKALSAAYAQQRKLTHDFRAHLSTLDGMLMQQNRDINTIQTYIHSLQSKQKRTHPARQYPPCSTGCTFESEGACCKKIVKLIYSSV